MKPIIILLVLSILANTIATFLKVNEVSAAGEILFAIGTSLWIAFIVALVIWVVNYRKEAR